MTKFRDMTEAEQGAFIMEIGGMIGPRLHEVSAKGLILFTGAVTPIDHPEGNKAMTLKYLSDLDDKALIFLLKTLLRRLEANGSDSRKETLPR